MTKELVYVQDKNLDKGKTVTSSFIIAENAGITHKAVKNQIVKYLSDFEEFGRVVFKKDTFDTEGGKSPGIMILNIR